MELEIDHQRRLNKYYTNCVIADIVFNDYIINLQKGSADINIKNNKIQLILDDYEQSKKNQKIFREKYKNIY